MQFQINREVIDSIKLARDFQLAAEPESGNASALARLAFNNGHRAELILNLKKLSQWARTFKQNQFDGSFNVELIDASRVGDRDYAGWLQVRAALTENRSSELRMCPGGLTYAEPIEVQIVAGVAQIVPSPGGETELKAMRAEARLASGRLRIQDASNKIRSKLARCQTALATGAENHAQSTLRLAAHSLGDALTNAKLRRGQERTYRQIRAEFDADLDVKDKLLALGLLDRPEEVSTVNWDGQDVTHTKQSAGAEYDYLREEFLKVKAKHDSYAPKRGWSRHASEERRRRADKMRRAKSNLWGPIHQELYLWRKEARDQDACYYQADRVTLRRWPRECARLQSEVATFEQELDAKREELERLEHPPEKPVKVKKAKRSKSTVGIEAPSNLIAKPSEPVTPTVPALSSLEAKSDHGLRISENVPAGRIDALAEIARQAEAVYLQSGPDAPTPIHQPSSTAAAVKEKIMSQVAPATDAITLTFVKEKETKNTIKFEEVERDGQPKIVGSLYVQRFIAKGREKLTLTITF